MVVDIKKLHVINIESLGAKIYLFFWCQEVFTELYKQTLWCDLDGWDFVEWRMFSKNRSTYVWVFSQDEPVSTTIHEVIHAVHYLFDYMWISLEYRNTETVAYTMEYAIIEALRFIRKQIKWKKKLLKEGIL